MKKTLLLIALFMTVVCLQGCVVIDVEETSTPVNAAKDDMMMEIDAVENLSFEGGRLEAYKKIAEREGLDANTQTYLIDAVFEKLNFENSKEDVLLTLINNPSFCSAGKRAILDNLNELAFENTKQNILNAISERGV